jgi:hypothetical protein
LHDGCFNFSAGQDATEAFYGLHRHEVLERPQYQRLQVGTIKGQQPVIHSRIVGEISDVPYAEPTWLSAGYHSPYYTEVSSFTIISAEILSETFAQNHRKFQKVMRLFADEIIYEDAQVIRHHSFITCT